MALGLLKNLFMSKNDEYPREVVVMNPALHEKFLKKRSKLSKESLPGKSTIIAALVKGWVSGKFKLNKTDLKLFKRKKNE